MKIGDKVFIDHIFKNGYIYGYDDIKGKYRIVVIENKINRFYDVYKQDLHIIQKRECVRGN